MRSLLAAVVWTTGILGVALAVAASDEIRALDGRMLSPQEPGDEFRQRQESLLAVALEEREAEPSDADAWIWVGRRQAYLGRYEEAIGTYSEALARFPEDARFLRHRGHRFITLRRLDEAIADLSGAAAMVEGVADVVEPDGLPNALGIPTSTLQTNIWYHLGLAHYLKGDFSEATAAYSRCRELSANNDMMVAASYWLYLSLRRGGEDARAQEVLTEIEPDLEIIENDGYYELLLAFAAGDDGELLLTRAGGDRSAVSFPTAAYGVGAWALVNERTGRALEIFRSILESPSVAAFGYIAAEAELSRLR